MYLLADKLSGDPYGQGETIHHPAIVGLTDQAWSVTCDGGPLMLVRTAPVAAFDGASVRDAIRPLRRALLANIGAIDDGETDDADDPELARKVARRFLLRQLLGADDFGINLAAKLGDLSAAQRLRIRNKLAAHRRPIDISALTSASLIGDALALILPQLAVRLDSLGVGKRGTFGDTFNNTGGSNTNLESWTPTGPNAGTGWTRVGGSAGKAQTSSTSQSLVNVTGGSVTLYQCDDQGDADQYVEFTAFNQGSAFAGCNRATAAEDFGVGIRFNASQLQVARFIAGAFTSLGAVAASTGSVFRLESSGDSHDTFIDGAPSGISTISESHNNTITRQGISARQPSGTYSIASTFEAGLLGGDASATVTAGALALAGATLAAGADQAATVSAGALLLAAASGLAATADMAATVAPGALLLAAAAGLAAAADQSAVVASGVLLLAAAGGLAVSAPSVPISRYLFAVTRDALADLLRKLLRPDDGDA